MDEFHLNQMHAQDHKSRPDDQIDDLAERDLFLSQKPSLFVTVGHPEKSRYNM